MCTVHCRSVRCKIYSCKMSSCDQLYPHSFWLFQILHVFIHSAQSSLWTWLSLAQSAWCEARSSVWDRASVRGMAEVETINIVSPPSPSLTTGGAGNCSHLSAAAAGSASMLGCITCLTCHWSLHPHCSIHTGLLGDTPPGPGGEARINGLLLLPVFCIRVEGGRSQPHLVISSPWLSVFCRTIHLDLCSAAAHF